ncbi:cyclophilin-like domain-containing protein [Chytridium lagenaria]|nr:cyclophilin-like domain-containing protein [Chytridium lagenaria]
MSYAYSSEPPTKGKVVLKTSLGDVEIEFWPKEAPKAVRNFVQLCMEGYYDNTIFHRVVKDFIVQGGDPTGTGTGGESIYGSTFPDEFHSRLRFTRRGLLAMANVGKNTNASQFFFTMDATEELAKKNTIFGKVVGDTIFNVLAIGDLEVDKNDRPLNPPKIFKAEILALPPEGPAIRIKSSHDVLRDDRLSKDAATVDDVPSRKLKESRLERDKAAVSKEEDVTRELKRKNEEYESQTPASKKAAVQSEIAKLQQEIRKIDSSRRAVAAEKDKTASSLVEQFRQKYAGKAIIGRRPKKGEETLIEELSAFKTKIFRSEPEEEDEAPAYVCDLHGIEECKSCKDTFGTEQKVTDSGWLAHKLRFAKDSANVYEPSVDDYVYFDPRDDPKNQKEKVTVVRK